MPQHLSALSLLLAAVIPQQITAYSSSPAPPASRLPLLLATTIPAHIAACPSRPAPAPPSGDGCPYPRHPFIRCEALDWQCCPEPQFSQYAKQACQRGDPFGCSMSSMSWQRAGEADEAAGDAAKPMDVPAMAVGMDDLQAPGPGTITPPDLFTVCCVVKLNNRQGDNGVNENNEDFENRRVVHRSQLVTELPSHDKQCFFGRNEGLLYRKYVIRFERAPEIANLVAMKLYLDSASCIEAVGNRSRVVLNLGCRFFVRVDDDKRTVAFICAEIHGDALRALCWSDNSLKRACELMWKEQQAANRDGPMSILPWRNTSECNGETGDTRMSDLPHSIMTNVLLNLDVHNQARTRRVCALWHVLLTETAAYVDIIVDICSHLTDEPHDQRSHACLNYTYKLIILMDQIVTPHTRTLVLLNGRAADLDFETGAPIAAKVSKAKAMQLSTIIVKDCSSSCEIARYDRREGYTCEYLSQIAAVCDQLLVMNYSVQNVLNSGNFARDFPEHERCFLRSKERIKLSVNIPHLRHRCTDAVDQMPRRFFIAANNNCPPIGQQVVAKIRAIHKRWVEHLDYPAGWLGIRDLLNICSGFLPDGSAHHWNNTDLRQLNVNVLTKLAMTTLDRCYVD
ncbi:uncharacterized protein LOC129591826 [Paramacrobiotus metropolitanus]|uniref:uncharacterized protein LOC129591826 n=1 Tax=Paramacrobiotus metropolitanus TaxID=2943436 RepID=UPI00244612F0|nr:uncharacterized protein LOC129591826 [Paramacrobiotus metropolitanus]